MGLRGLKTLAQCRVLQSDADTGATTAGVLDIA
jgi:hypothetical protein